MIYHLYVESINVNKIKQGVLNLEWSSGEVSRWQEILSMIRFLATFLYQLFIKARQILQ